MENLENKKIHYFKYLIAHGVLQEIITDVQKETEKCYFTDYIRLLKKDDGVAEIKDRTCYPYITFYSTENSSREFAVKKIIEYLTDHWGLH